MVQWAAGYWQLDVCRLLIAKGADVEARNWGGMFVPATPLGFACRTFSSGCDQCVLPNFRPKHATDTLSLLLESGLDIQASVEIDDVLIGVGDSISGERIPHLIKRAVAQQLSWLVWKYKQDTTCDGLLSFTNLHPAVHEGIRQSNIYSTFVDGFWDEERSDCKLLTYMDAEAFQSFWIYQMAPSEMNGVMLSDISSEFFQGYTGNFHYQQSWKIGDHAGWDSPMQLALRSFAALGTLRHILMASGTDVADFARTECTMPWCTQTQETLTNFLSLEPQRYTVYESFFSKRKMCPCCLEIFQHEGVMDWEEACQLVNSGRSLASLLEYPSQAEEERLNFLVSCCETCRVHTQAPPESDDSEDDTEDDDDEHMGFIESEIGDDEDNPGDLSVSRMEHEQMEDYADGDSSDESSSDEDLGGEQVGWEHSYV